MFGQNTKRHALGFMDFNKLTDTKNLATLLEATEWTTNDF